MSVEFIGFLAAAASVSIALPQLVRLLRSRRVDGIAGSAWALNIANSLFWGTYGVLRHLPAEIACNVTVIALDIAVVAAARRYGHRRITRQCAFATVVCIPGIALTVATSPALAAYLAIAVGIAQFAPHAYRTARADGAAGVPPTMFVVCLAANVLWSAYGFGHHAPTVWAPAALNGAAAAALAVLIASKQRAAERDESADEAPTGSVIAIAA
jgi:uncharacterized protein with PQ loop repeat